MPEPKKFGKDWTMVVFGDAEDDPGHCAACGFDFSNLTSFQFEIMTFCPRCGRTIEYIEPEEVRESSSCW